MIKVNPQIRPELDKNYVPAVLWNREYRKLASESGKAVPVVMRSCGVQRFNNRRGL